MGKYSFMFYFDWKPYLNRLPDNEARGRFLMALIDYASEGKIYAPDDPVEQLLFDFCKNAIDRDQEKYQLRCQQNAANANKRWQRRDNANACERIRTHANDADMDKDIDMDKDKEHASLSAPAAKAASGHLIRAVQPDAADPEGEERDRRPKVIYTR